jgi:phosphomannomutase
VTGTTGWWLIRASNTEAALVARAEAVSPEALTQLTSEIQAALADADLSWSLD